MLANTDEPALCPLAAYCTWREIRESGSDVTGSVSDAAPPLFVGLSKAGRLSTEALSDKAVWRLVRQAARKAGIDGWERYSGNSLKRGACHGCQRGRS